MKTKRKKKEGMTQNKTKKHYLFFVLYSFDSIINRQGIFFLFYCSLSGSKTKNEYKQFLDILGSVLRHSVRETFFFGFVLRKLRRRKYFLFSSLFLKYKEGWNFFSLFCFEEIEDVSFIFWSCCLHFNSRTKTK